MKNAYTTLLLFAIATLTLQKLTLRQAVELDVNILQCRDLDDINVMITDITQWKEAIDLNNQLNDDLNGLLEVERIVKNTKLSLQHQQSFAEIELKRDVQATFEIDLAKIMDLIQQMNKKQSKKDKLELLTEIDICIQATKQKLQSTLTQTQHASQDDFAQLTINLKQLLHIKQQCQKQQQTNRQKIGRNNKHYKPYSYDEYDDDFQAVFSYDDDYDYDYYDYDYDYDDYSEQQYIKQKRKQNNYQKKQKQQQKQPKIQQPIKNEEQYPEEQQTYDDEEQQQIEQSNQDDYYVEEPKAYDALDPQNQYNVIQNDHIIENQNDQRNDQNDQPDDQNDQPDDQNDQSDDQNDQPQDDQQESQEFVDDQQQSYEEQQQQSQEEQQQQYEEQQNFQQQYEEQQNEDLNNDDNDDNYIQPTEDGGQRFINLQNDDYDYQQDVDYQLEQENKAKNKNLQQIDDPALQENQFEDYQNVDVVTDEVKLDNYDDLYQNVNQVITAVPDQLQQNNQTEEFKLTEQSKQGQPQQPQQGNQQPQQQANQQQPIQTVQQQPQQSQQQPIQQQPQQAPQPIQQPIQQQPTQPQQQPIQGQPQQQPIPQGVKQQQPVEQPQQQPTQQPQQQQSQQAAQQPSQAAAQPQQPSQLQQPVQAQPTQPQQPVQAQPTQPQQLPTQPQQLPTQQPTTQSGQQSTLPGQQQTQSADQQPIQAQQQPAQQPLPTQSNQPTIKELPLSPVDEVAQQQKAQSDQSQQNQQQAQQPAVQQSTTDPTQKPTVDPIQQPVNPTQQPVDSTQKPVDPTQQSVDPTQQPVAQQPTVDPAQLPTTQQPNIDPSQQPEQPTNSDQPQTKPPASPTELIRDNVAQAPLAAKAEDNPDQLIDPVKFVPFKHKPLQSTANILVRQSKYYDSTVDGQASYEIQFSNKELQDSEEYGYGYWVRSYEDLQPNEYYFLSRLTSLKEYLDYQNYGDRTLTNFMVGNSFVFATYDYVGREKNKVSQITLSQSIVQRWYFISFSYSSRKQKAVGFVLNYGKEFQRVEIPCTHAPPFYMYMLMGGKHQHYKGLSGQFANIFYDVEAPALIDNEQELFALVETMSYMPQSLKTYHEEMIVGPPVDLDGNTACNYEKGFKDAFIYEHYAVAGWFRWVDNLDVMEVNSFQIMNLRSNKARVKENRQLGDRALEVHFIRGLQNVGVNFQTYSVAGNDGKGTYLIIKQVPYTTNLWTFVYYGFNQEEKKAYGVLIRSGSNEEVTIEGLQHRNSNSLYFTLGGDQTVASFNGRLAQVGVYLGPESFARSRKMDYNFGYGDGAVRLFQLVKPLILRGQQDMYEIAYDQSESLINQILVQDDNNIKINGLSEYGIGIWTCWLSSSPKYINSRSDYHQIIRMGTQPKLLELKDNKLIQSSVIQDIKDTTLQMRVAKAEYEFSTYNLPTNDIKKTAIQLDSQLEGSWNYLYFSYKRMSNGMGLAKGYVQFGVGGQIKECQVEVLHEYLMEYIELNVGKSNIPQFNGKLANVQMRIGNGGFIQDIAQLTSFQQLEKPLQGISASIRKSIQLLSSETDMIKIKEEQNIFEQQQNTGEYSLSGWVKWGGEQKQGGLYSVFMMVQKRLQDIKPGQTDSQLFVQRTDKDFIFGTYNCNGEDCTQQQEKNIEFGEYYNQWIFIYVGYSSKNKKLFTMCKFTFNQQQQIFQDINRVLLSTFTIFLGKHYQLANQWVGYIKQWVLNVGDGSYVEGGFESNETVELYFGYNSGSDHLKFQQANQEIDHSEKIIDSQADKPNIPWMIELNDQSNIKIEGVTSYGYGLWTRFRFYGQSILYTQPKWMGISRLTVNKDYRDSDTIGDRVLMILFGKGEDDKQIFQFSTYTIGQPNVFATTQYYIEYESEWVYLYYSYKRISQTQGIAIGYVGRLNIVDETKIEALHNPINNYILLNIGHCGKYYPNFNGQLTGIKFRLGNGAFIENKNDILQRIQNTDRMPQLPYDVTHKYTIMDGKIDNYKIIPNNPQMIDFAANEYSTALWYKYPTKINDNRETVFRVTQNPIGKVSDSSWVGDRTLSLFKVNTDNMEFSTYTLLKGMNFGIPYNCQIPELSQHHWSFIYIGYKKQEKRLFYQLMVDEYICKSEETILHAISDRMWIYVGSDNIQQRFEGNLAQIALTIGPGSYTNSKIPFLAEYLVADKLFPKQKKISWEKNEPIQLQSDGDEVTSSLKVELFNGFQYPFDSMQEYAYGLWTRYLTTIPERQYTKPALMQLARLSINKELAQGVIKPGDRVLATHIVFNYYQLSTYDLNTDSGVQQKFMKYNQIEGVWRYIYLGYSKDIETVSCYTYDTQINEIKIDKILHKPLSDYLLFWIGKEDTTPGFQGIITKIMLSIGPGAYIKQQDQFRSQIDTTFSLPFQLTQEYTDKEKHGKFEIIEDINQIDITNGIQFEGNRWSGISEYAFSGWIKQTGTSQTDCQLLLRLTNNKQDVLNDRKSQGDRTLHMTICNAQLIKFSTYTLIDLKDANEPKYVDAQLELNDYNYAWNYVYMAYNQRTNEVHSLLHTLIEDKPLLWKSILHYVPNYLGLYIGQDKFTSKFIGSMNKWTAAYGLGAFVSLSKNGYQQQLPYYSMVQANKQFQWNSNKDTVYQTPEFVMQEFTSEIDSITEYAFGVWTRWLTDFPDHLSERKESHSIFRLTAKKEHQDKSQFLDRVLSTFLIKGSYDFSSYDMSTNNFAANSLAAYEQIEGQWNFVYMAYKEGQVVGIVIVRDSAKALKVQFAVKHVPLVGYAKLLIGVPEFGHGQFHGWFFDPRLYLGQGSFVGESQRVVDLLQKIHRKLPLPAVDLADFKWAIPLMDTTEQIKTGYIDYKFLDKQESVEYSYGMWIQQSTLLPGMPVVPRLIARLTTNHPQFQKDAQLGDRTLLVSILNDKITYNTYLLQDPPTFIDKQEQLTIETLQWTYVFFQYKKGTALAYSLQVKQPQFKQIQALHVIPNVFYFYLIKDQSFAEFYGKMSDVKLYFGSSSYFDDPQVTIEKWPFDKKYLQPANEPPINNQQITSAKISRNMDIQNEKYTGDY